VVGFNQQRRLVLPPQCAQTAPPPLPTPARPAPPPPLQAFINTAREIYKKIQDGVFDVSNEVREGGGGGEPALMC